MNATMNAAMNATMKTKPFLRPPLLLVIVPALVFLVAANLHAGGPAWVAGAGYNRGVEGQSMLWTSATVQYFTDQGDLSPILTNAQADSFVAAAISAWTTAAGVSLTVTQGGHLAEDVNGGDIQGQFGVITAPADITSSPPARRSASSMTSTAPLPMRCSAQAPELPAIASPTPSTAVPTTSRRAATLCMRWRSSMASVPHPTLSCLMCSIGWCACSAASLAWAGRRPTTTSSPTIPSQAPPTTPAFRSCTSSTR